MRIVMLNGQNHKGSTYQIGRMIAEKIAGDNEITEFFFPRDLNHFCVGCYNCIEDGTACPFYSDKQRILDAIDAADILVVTTPTYCMHISAPLKEAAASRRTAFSHAEARDLRRGIRLYAKKQLPCRG